MPPSTYPTYGLPLLQRPNDDLPYTPDTASYSPTPGGQFIGKPAVHSPIGPRTPSPTPSESKALKAGVLDWKSLVNWRFWFRKEWICASLACAPKYNGPDSCTTHRVLRRARRDSCYNGSSYPVSHANRGLADARYEMATRVSLFAVPLHDDTHHVVQSEIRLAGANRCLVRHILPPCTTPPSSTPVHSPDPLQQLFGHEIVAILCGLVWGLWIGFGIVAAGTFIGEVGNF